MWRQLVWMGLFSVVACKGDTPEGSDTDTDADTDTDSDADSDTDADVDTGDTDTDIPREDCPTDGRALVVVNVLAAPAILPTDQVTVNLFPVYPGPPIYYYVRPGSNYATLPALARDNNVPANTYVNVVFCLDKDSDSLNTCDGPGDVLLEIPAPLTLAAGDQAEIDVDFTAETVSATTFGTPPADCP